MMKNYLKIKWKALLTFALMAFVSFSLSATTTVTLRVDMAGQGVSEAFVAGTLNAWIIAPMTREGETDVYYIELELTPGVLETYYFLSANDWGAREAVPEDCWGGEWDNHRGFTVPDEAVTYGYMYGGCDPVGSEAPDPVEKFDVTLRVDMTGEDVSNGVFVTGSITAPGGGNWIYVAMEKEGETDIYSTTVSLEEGSYTFVFWRHNNWDNDYRETVPMECEHSEAERSLVVVDAEKTVGFVFGTCDPIGTTVSIENDEVLNVEVFPVPASDFLFVELPTASGSALITIYSMNGAKVYSQINSSVEGRISINVSSFQAGVYLIEVEMDNKRAVKKVTIN